MTQKQSMTHKMAGDPATRAELAGLFTEMQALMALMPGAAFAKGEQLPTEDETEALFDNMPV